MRRILRLLADGDFESLGNTGGLSTAADLSRAASDYGRTIVMPPESALHDLELIPIEGTDPQQWHLDCDLWTLEEGRSDLTLQVVLIGADDDVRVRVDDLHVL